MSRVAVIQRPPVFLDRAETLKNAVAAVAEAAGNMAQLAVFPEALVPGYPAWMWRLRPGPDMALTERQAAQHAVVCGIQERDTEFGGGTLYNTVVTIGPDGAVLNRHRKLMPTNPERMVWGCGDATGLKAVDTPCGRIGTPAYDNGERAVATMQHIAREGGCWVVSCGCAFQARDIPDAFPGKTELFPDPDEWVNPGDSVVVAPGGKIVAGPLHQERSILYAEIDLDRVGMARRSLDVVGHYARPDLFQLQVNSRPQTPLHPA
jgi:nitrilase